MTNRRIELLTLLLENRFTEEDIHELKQLGWDSAEDLVTLERRHLRQILQQFLDGGVTPKQVYRWASALECREDVGFEAEHENVLQDAVFRLATSEVEGELTEEDARELLEKLKPRG